MLKIPEGALDTVERQIGGEQNELLERIAIALEYEYESSPSVAFMRFWQSVFCAKASTSKAEHVDCAKFADDSLKIFRDTWGIKQ